MEGVDGQTWWRGIDRQNCPQAGSAQVGTGTATFGAADPHDGLEADLPAEVAFQVPLELLQLSRVVDVMEGGVVEDATGRVLGDTRWGERRHYF